MLNDFQVLKSDGGSGSPSSNPYKQKAGGTAIQTGEIVIKDGVNPGYVTTIPDGASNTLEYVGVSASNSTVTATADGDVRVFDDPNQVIVGSVTTPGNLAQALMHTKVTFDVVATVQKIDENDTTNGVAVLQKYDATTGKVHFKIAASAYHTN